MLCDDLEGWDGGLRERVYIYMYIYIYIYIERERERALIIKYIYL